MAKAFVRVLVGLLSIALGYFIFNFWGSTRPNDPQMTAIGAGIVVVIASFIALSSMTKGGGD
ncbi:MAG: hypothetical protein Q7S22_04190 [Candidatus Micrarchaeota archaeon]|nr:hypothetical protein [Candidatus Micrarchaeota archaeon]